MQNVRAVEQTSLLDERTETTPAFWGAVWPWIAGTVIALVVGSWLVWLAAYVQRSFAEDDIRKACQHLMPETADRCFDTVVIQRGGVRR